MDIQAYTFYKHNSKGAFLYDSHHKMSFIEL